MSISIYQYLSENNPDKAQEIIGKYGYSVENVSSKGDLAECLKMLTANEGEQVLYDIANNHPDASLILEANQQDNGIIQTHKCNCGKGNNSPATDSYMQAMKPASNESTNFLSINQNGLLLLGGLLIITLAFIASKN